MSGTLHSGGISGTSVPVYHVILLLKEAESEEMITHRLQVGGGVGDTALERLSDLPEIIVAVGTFGNGVQLSWPVI